MTKIRKLTPFDIGKIKKMIDYLEPGMSSSLISERKFTLFPFDIFHDFLPINLRFLQESYVAVEGSELLGLLGLIPDGNQKSRWRINRLILNTNAYDIGKLLIDYVVNKYGGSGVETFLTTIDENYAEAISLFKNSCGFRSCTQIQVWTKENILPVRDFEKPSLLRDVKPSDAPYIQDLEGQNLFPQFRPSLTKNINDYKFGIKDNIVDTLRGYRARRMVLENPRKNIIEGYVNVTTINNIDFWADISLSLAYQEYYEDILNYIMGYVYKQNPNAKLYVYVRKYYQSNFKLTEILTEFKFKQSQCLQVLVKDYWKAAKVPSEGKKAPIVLFPDITSPACNMVSESKYY